MATKTHYSKMSNLRQILSLLKKLCLKCKEKKENRHFSGNKEYESKRGGGARGYHI